MNDNLVDAINSIDYKMIKRVAEQRMRSLNKSSYCNFYHRKPSVVKKGFVYAGIIVLVLCVSVPQVSSLIGQKIGQGIIYDYAPPYDTPSLKKIYRSKPYNTLLPRKMLEGLSFYSSYNPKYNGETNIYRYLELIMTTDGYKEDESHLFYEQGGSTLEISISEDIKSGIFAKAEDPQTYKLSLFYDEYINLLQEYIPNDYSVNGLFYAEELNKEILSERIYYPKENYVECVASIEIICGEYRISYCYRGQKITVDDFCDMVFSSKFFKKVNGGL